MTNETMILFSMVCLPVIAFLYASVGHGGASGYLALMSLAGMSPAAMKPTALLLNILVSGIAFFYFRKAGYFKLKLFAAFAIGSVPFSFVGGMIDTNPVIYKLILGVFLILATLKLLGAFNVKKNNPEVENRPVNFYLAFFIGSAIGFLSGLIGIGGGIILSPVILLLGWANLKEAAAVSALFILVNSISGFAGQATSGTGFPADIAWMMSLAATGGLAGAYVGTFRFNNSLLKKVLAFVLLTASVKLLVI